jgi:hypothetical protein
MRPSFMGDDVYKTYPLKPLRTQGSQLVPVGPKAKSRRAIFEVLGSDSARLVATAISNKINEGGPDFDSNDFNSSKNTKTRGRGYGDGKNNGNNSRRRSGNGSNSTGSSTRGYQTQPGVGCLLFNSGVGSGLTVNTRVVAKDYTPLYMASGWFYEITDVNINRNDDYTYQLRNIIYPLVESNISNRIQRYVGRYISSDDYEQYINCLTKGLQTYYCLDNVLTYRSNNSIPNINVGMEYLQAKLSSETIVELNLLRETLETCNCPPNLLDYIRFMCQSYRLSDAPHSPIIKLNIGGMFDEEWVLGARYITELIIDCRMNLVKANKMVSYLNQTFPSWLIQSLPQSANEACFNKDFITFWHNQNCSFLSTNSANNGNFEYSIDVKDLDSYTDYQIIQNQDEVDGVIFVSQTYNIPGNDKNKLNTYWGGWQPLASVDQKNTKAGDTRYTFNIKCFTLNSKIESCTDATMLGASGIYNLVEYSGAPGNYTANLVKFGAYGFVKLQNVSVRMQTEAFNNTMRFWFGL